MALLWYSFTLINSLCLWQMDFFVGKLVYFAVIIINIFTDTEVESNEEVKPMSTKHNGAMFYQFYSLSFLPRTLRHTWLHELVFVLHR